jgi:trk system potassium uptake protein TrkH
MHYGIQINYKTLTYINSIFIAFLACIMFIPFLVDLVFAHPNYKFFLISCLSMGFISGIIIIAAKPESKLTLNLKEGFFLITSCWVSICFCASIPLMMSGFSATDSLFEVVSSLTTTGATVFPSKTVTLSKGTQIWCTILQWFGGIGIIVMAMSVMPMLRIGGMQLLRMESADRSDKLLPRVSQVAGSIFGIYVFLTLIAMLLLQAAGMSIFESICYSMGALSTGGIAIWNDSINHYNNFAIELIMVVFMIIGATPLFLFVKLWRGEWNALWKDNQSRTYYLILLGSSIITAFWLWNERGFDLFPAIRHSIFNIVSVATSTGYTSTNYVTWGGFPILLLLFLSIIGGCTGSTAGGVKVFRLQVLYAIAKTQIKQMLHPHGVFVPIYQNRHVSEAIVASVLTYFVLWGVSFVVLSLILAFCGLSFSSAFYTALAMLSNLGLAFSDGLNISSNFSFFSTPAKWFMMLGMILGRLEFVTLFALISPTFWRD